MYVNAPLPGCCNSCHEPVTQRQRSVLFEGTNLRYPQLGENTAIFHTRRSCLWDAQGYDEAWAQAAPGRVPKFPGWAAGGAWLRLIEATANTDPDADGGAPVALCLVGGAFDGACMNVSASQELQEVLYTESVPQPRKAAPGIWYAHAANCACGMTGTGSMRAGMHTYVPKLNTDS